MPTRERGHYENPDPTPRQQWLVHHPWVMAIPLVVFGVFYVLVHNWLGWPALLAQWALLAFYFRAETRHMHGLCHLCISRVPLDGDLEVIKYNKALWTSHWLVRRRNGYLATAAVITVYWGTALISDLAGAFGTTLIWCWFSFRTHLTIIHHRLGPWCPLCRHGGWDDGKEPIIVPDPVPSASKTN